jgi:nucleotide-binding universal stress UspA family protein
MYKSILIPVGLDHVPIVPRKLELARHMLAQGGRITLVTVLEQVSGFVAEFVTVKSENHLVQKIQQKLEEVAGGADDIACEVIVGKPRAQIPKYAENIGADLIIVGSHKTGPQSFPLGSTAGSVVQRAPCSVMVMR